MFLKLFYSLKVCGVPVTIREYLDMLKALDKGLCKKSSIDDFYVLSRLTLVKDEKYFDRFDKAFKSFYENNKNIFLELKKKYHKNGLKMSWKNFFLMKSKKN